MRKATAFIIAAFAWTGFIGEYFFTNATKVGAALAASSLNYFSFFTTLSNLFVAAGLTAYLVAPTSRLGRFFGGPRGATPLAFYITITGLVFWFVLRETTHPVGLGIGLNAIHHYIVPVAYPLWWLFFVRKGELRLWNVIDWMIFPALYGLYTVLHGQESAFYPYGFVDLPRLGLEGVIRNMALFGIQFAMLATIYVLIDRVIGYARGQGRTAGPVLPAVPVRPASPVGTAKAEAEASTSIVLPLPESAAPKAPTA